MAAAKCYCLGHGTSNEAEFEAAIAAMQLLIDWCIRCGALSLPPAPYQGKNIEEKSTNQKHKCTRALAKTPGFLGVGSK